MSECVSKSEPKIKRCPDDIRPFVPLSSTTDALLQRIRAAMAAVRATQTGRGK